MAKRNAPGEPPEKQHVPEAISKGKWFSNHHFSGGLMLFSGDYVLGSQKNGRQKDFWIFFPSLFPSKIGPLSKIHLECEKSQPLLRCCIQGYQDDIADPNSTAAKWMRIGFHFQYLETKKHELYSLNSLI